MDTGWWFGRICVWSWRWGAWTAAGCIDWIYWFIRLCSSVTITIMSTCYYHYRYYYCCQTTFTASFISQVTSEVVAELFARLKRVKWELRALRCWKWCRVMNWMLCARPALVRQRGRWILFIWIWVSIISELLKMQTGSRVCAVKGSAHSYDLIYTCSTRYQSLQVISSSMAAAGNRWHVGMKAEEKEKRTFFSPLNEYVLKKQISYPVTRGCHPRSALFCKG